MFPLCSLWSTWRFLVMAWNFKLYTCCLISSLLNFLDDIYFHRWQPRMDNSEDTQDAANLIPRPEGTGSMWGWLTWPCPWLTNKAPGCCCLGWSIKGSGSHPVAFDPCQMACISDIYIMIYNRAKLWLWSSSAIILWIRVTTTRNSIKGCNIRNVKNHWLSRRRALLPSLTTWAPLPVPLW